MDVKTVCLGMLTDGPASGYDLKKYFESTFGHFFAAGFGSIYPALNSLAEQGLVRCEEIPQYGRPDRKVYSITDAGYECLRSALDNPAPAHKIRSEFLATLFFAHLMSDEQIDAVLDNRIREVQAFLELLDGMDLEETGKWPAGARFVAGFGRTMATACRDYIHRNRHMLTADPDQDLEPARDERAETGSPLKAQEK
ncbi:MAG: PadR family transcriptional regulator [Woeseiaceae bacterium]|nr:PadR family transcriptional regulator [Woeseiaceae bacterium]